MDPMWLLKGDRTAPGWRKLEQDSKADKIAMVAFDRAEWALVEAPEAPDGYEGLTPVEPEDGLYVSEQGIPIYVVGRKEVRRAEDVIKALGQEAEDLLAEVGDPDTVLQRLGRAY